MPIFKWLLVILLIYLTGLLAFGPNFLFIDSVNLVMHEAGHLILMFTGTTLSALGGTLLQLLIPLICGAVLVMTQHDWFGGGVCAWWLGENLVNVGTYMADAPYQLLPLIGGEHDWAYLFGLWGVLEKAEIIGQYFSDLGMIIMILSLIWLILQLVIAPRLSL